MAVLKIERGAEAGTSFFVDKESILGRDPTQSSIHLKDIKASRSHARIFLQDKQFYLKDLDSTNGTFLNGKPVEGEQLLEPGDYISIGFTWLSFGEEQEIEQIAQNLVGYEILQEIGEVGGTGLYFKVRQIGLDRVVALNLLPPNLLKTNPQLPQRFREQATRLARLNHENVSLLLDFEANASYLYLTTEYLEGESLSHLLRRSDRLPPAKALEIGVGVARALSHAHEREVVHQDLKPVNILLTQRRVIVGGFGVGAVLATVQDKFSSFTGMLEYLSPEQVQKQEVDYRTDIYALGVILYEMFTGHVPFRSLDPDEIMQSHLNQTPAPLTDFPTIPHEVDGVIFRCLEKDPQRRPANCQEIVAVLEEALDRQLVINLSQSPEVGRSFVQHLFATVMDSPWIPWLLFPCLTVLILLVSKILFEVVT